MKKPVSPPPLLSLIDKVGAGRLSHLVGAGIGVLPQNEYPHWSRLRYLEPPTGYSTEEWWIATRRAPVQYARAYLFTETDDCDVTYFLDYHLRVVLRAIRQLRDYLARKLREINETQQLLEGMLPAAGLNYRRLALIMSMRKHPDRWYTIQGHRQAHKVAYQTVRTDLLKLAELKLLTPAKRGRAFIFRLAQDFDERLRELANAEVGR